LWKIVKFLPKKQKNQSHVNLDSKGEM
jgi:hypothetical protein